MSFSARLYVADKALDQGRGGISRLAELTGMRSARKRVADDHHQSGRGIGKAKEVSAYRGRKDTGGRCRPQESRTGG